MPRAKPKTCSKCGRMYIGWRCPHCYRKTHKSCGSSRSSSTRRFGIASLLSPTLAPATAPATSTVSYGQDRICTYCHFLTTTHPCSYCGRD